MWNLWGTIPLINDRPCQIVGWKIAFHLKLDILRGGHGMVYFFRAHQKTQKISESQAWESLKIEKYSPGDGDFSVPSDVGVPSGELT